MKSVLYIVLCLATAAVAAWQMYAYVASVTNKNASGNMNHLWISIACIVVALIFGGLYLSGRVNQEEELHVTK